MRHIVQNGGAKYRLDKMPCYAQSVSVLRITNAGCGTGYTRKAAALQLS